MADDNGRMDEWIPRDVDQYLRSPWLGSVFTVTTGINCIALCGVVVILLLFLPGHQFGIALFVASRSCFIEHFIYVEDDCFVLLAWFKSSVFTRFVFGVRSLARTKDYFSWQITLLCELYICRSVHNEDRLDFDNVKYGEQASVYIFIQRRL